MGIRSVRESELGVASALDSQIFGTMSYSSLVIRQAFDVFQKLFRVYENPDGAIVGYILGAISTKQTDAWILVLGVAEHCRGRGVGTALIRNLLAMLGD